MQFPKQIFYSLRLQLEQSYGTHQLKAEKFRLETLSAYIISQIHTHKTLSTLGGKMMIAPSEICAKHLILKTINKESISNYFFRLKNGSEADSGRNCTCMDNVSSESVPQINVDRETAGSRAKHKPSYQVPLKTKCRRKTMKFHF